MEVILYDLDRSGREGIYRMHFKVIRQYSLGCVVAFYAIVVIDHDANIVTYESDDRGRGIFGDLLIEGTVTGLRTFFYSAFTAA